MTKKRVRSIVELVSPETLRQLFHGLDFDQPDTVAKVRASIVCLITARPPSRALGSRLTPHVFAPRRQSPQATGREPVCRRCNRAADDVGHLRAELEKRT